MDMQAVPAPHEDPELELFRPYITESVQALQAEGVPVLRSWLDPSGPRDATIVCELKGEEHALVWDEETGWRVGEYRGGRPGERTRLDAPAYLGGGVLPEPREVAARYVGGVTEGYRKFRDHGDDAAGFDASVRARYVRVG